MATSKSATPCVGRTKTISCYFGGGTGEHPETVAIPRGAGRDGGQLRRGRTIVLEDEFSQDTCAQFAENSESAVTPSLRCPGHV